MFLSNKKTGFTLSEVLITLGLLGVISAITMPSLAYNYRSKVLEEQFHSAYSDIRQVAAYINHEHGDIGEWARKMNFSPQVCLKDKDGNQLSFSYGSNPENNGNPYVSSCIVVDGGTITYAREFMKYVNGGTAVDAKAGWQGDGKQNGGIKNIQQILQEYYKSAGSHGPYAFPKNSKVGSGAFCDNGGIWLDAKGRIYTFNSENEVICIDVNGTSLPNRLNVDIFAFTPLNARAAAVFAHNAINVKDIGEGKKHAGKTLRELEDIVAKEYSGEIVVCDVVGMAPKNNTRLDEAINKSYTEQKKDTPLMYCPFNEPVENVAPVPKTVNEDGSISFGTSGTSSRGRTVTRQNNYWKDYIDYK